MQREWIELMREFKPQIGLVVIFGMLLLAHVVIYGGAAWLDAWRERQDRD